MLETVFLRVLEMSWRAGYCILAVLAVRVLLHKAPRRYLYGLWLVAAFRLVCPVSVGTEFSLFNLEWKWGQETEVTENTGRAEAPGIFMEAGEPHAVPDGAERREELSVSGAGWAYVWLFGVTAFLLYLAVSLRKLKGSVRMAVRTGAVSRTGEESLPRKRGSVEIYECEGLCSPFVMGVFRPRIYLPWGLSGEARRMVLLHERYHIRRGDHLVKYTAFVLFSVYWFHPLVWAAWFGMCRDMEMSCDERVLERLGAGSGKAYSEALLSLAAQRPFFSGQAPGFGEQDIKRRIRHALSFRTPAVWAGAAALLAVAAAVLLLGTDGIREEPVPKTMAEELYEVRNPYIGDVSAEGRLLRKIYEALPENTAAETAFKTELQTTKEPYEFHFLMESGQEQIPTEEEMKEAAVLMLALTDNLGVVRWTLVSPEGILLAEEMLDAETSAELLGVEDIKELGSSPERVQTLLELLPQIQAE